MIIKKFQALFTLHKAGYYLVPLTYCMILPIVEIRNSPKRGRGVFAKASIKQGTVTEISPVIVLTEKERKTMFLSGEQIKKRLAWRLVIFHCTTIIILPIVNMKWILKNA